MSKKEMVIDEVKLAEEIMKKWNSSTGTAVLDNDLYFATSHKDVTEKSTKLHRDNEKNFAIGTLGAMNRLLPDIAGEHKTLQLEFQMGEGAVGYHTIQRNESGNYHLNTQIQRTLGDSEVYERMSSEIEQALKEIHER